MLEPLHVRRLERSLWVPAPIDEVFGFFSQTGNLDRITPPWLDFRILYPDFQDLRKGSRIDYLLRLYGIPFKWVSEITEWDPPHGFTDRQIKGPYHYWDHRHTFTARDGGTTVQDSVRFAVPGFFLEPIVFHLFVRTQLRRIFDFREEQILRIFGGEAE